MELDGYCKSESLQAGLTGTSEKHKPGASKRQQEGWVEGQKEYFPPLFSPGEAAFGYYVQFWCPQVKQENQTSCPKGRTQSPQGELGEPGGLSVYGRRWSGICSQLAAT